MNQLCTCFFFLLYLDSFLLDSAGVRCAGSRVDRRLFVRVTYLQRTAPPSRRCNLHVGIRAFLTRCRPCPRVLVIERLHDFFFFSSRRQFRRYLRSYIFTGIRSTPLFESSARRYIISCFHLPSRYNINKLL